MRSKAGSVTQRADGVSSAVFYMGIFLVSAVVGVFLSQS